MITSILEPASYGFLTGCNTSSALSILPFLLSSSWVNQPPSLLNPMDIILFTASAICGSVNKFIYVTILWYESSYILLKLSHYLLLLYAMQDSLFLTSWVCSTLLILIPCDTSFLPWMSHTYSPAVSCEICGNGQESLQVFSISHCISSLHHCSTYTHIYHLA